MLGLGIGTSSTQYSGGWLPSEETTLEAWWRNGEGITARTELGVRYVTEWADQSGNGHDMLQDDTGEQPTYNATTGALTFDPTSDTQNLAFTGGASPTSIELDVTFVIGIKMNPAAVSTVVLGSNAKSNEMIKVHSGSVMRVKNDTASNDFTLDSGDTKDDSYWVITRDSSNDVTLYKDGVRNPSGSAAIIGTFDIDAIGVRRTNQNPFNGTVKEVVIFKAVEDVDVNDLVANVNDRLSGL